MDAKSKQVVSFMNMKGGVGKTTLCINIANTLSSYFKKDVLLIDMDPQFNATQSILSIVKDDYMQFYNSTKKNKKTIYYLFSDGHQKQEILKMILLLYLIVIIEQSLI